MSERRYNISDQRRQRDDDDTQLLADGCTALLRSVFGHTNWSRWNEVKRRTSLGSLQAFITWMLDIAEQEVNRATGDTQVVYKYEEQRENVDCERTEGVNDGTSGLSAGYMGGEDEELIDSGFGRDGHGEDEEGDVVILEGDTSCDTKLEAIQTGDDLYSEQGFVDANQSDNADSYYQHSLPSTSTQPAFDGTQHSDMNVVDIMFDTKIFFCKHCNVSLSDMEVVKEHLKLRHPEQFERISCFCCSQTFSSTQLYVDFHKANVALSTPNSKPKKFVCDYCAKGFKLKQDMEDHVANKHFKMGPRHECEYCQKKFSHANNLRIHKKKCMIGVTATT